MLGAGEVRNDQARGSEEGRCVQAKREERWVKGEGCKGVRGGEGGECVCYAGGE